VRVTENLAKVAIRSAGTSFPGGQVTLVAATPMACGRNGAMHLAAAFIGR
jgi:hypothetical protein